jgi:hypothetical protein
VHTVGLLAGLVLALVATVAVFSTDDARFLPVALLAACWTLLVTAFLAGGRRADQVAAQAREAELRHAHEVEREREVAARARYELELAQRLRRETEEGMRRELADLRSDLAGLAGLRGDLAALGELRTDLGRLRGELAEQLSGELLVERMVMRAQTVRLPAERSGHDDRTLDGGPAGGSWGRTTVARWTDDRDEPGSSVDPVATARALRPAPSPSAEAPPWAEPTQRLARVDGAPADGPTVDGPAPRSPLEWLVDRPVVGPGDLTGPALDAAPTPVPVDRAHPAGPAPTAPAADTEPAADSEPAVATESDGTGAPGEPAAERPVPRSRYRVGLDAAAAGPGAVAPRRHRRAAEPTAESVAPAEPSVADPTPAPQPVAPQPVDPQPVPDADPAAETRAAAGAPREAPGSARLAQILAGSGVTPAPGRRRRRYRDEDDPQPQPQDDVLARVLGRN